MYFCFESLNDLFRISLLNFGWEVIDKSKCFPWEEKCNFFFLEDMAQIHIRCFEDSARKNCNLTRFPHSGVCKVLWAKPEPGAQILHWYMAISVIDSQERCRNAQGLLVLWGERMKDRRQGLVPAKWVTSCRRWQKKNKVWDVGVGFWVWDDPSVIAMKVFDSKFQVPLDMQFRPTQLVYGSHVEYSVQHPWAFRNNHIL